MTKLSMQKIPKEPTKMLLELISNYSKFTDYEVIYLNRPITNKEIG